MILVLWNNQSHQISFDENFRNNHLNEIFLFPGFYVLVFHRFFRYICLPVTSEVRFFFSHRLWLIVLILVACSLYFSFSVVLSLKAWYTRWLMLYSFLKLIYGIISFADDNIYAFTHLFLSYWKYFDNSRWWNM